MATTTTRVARGRITVVQEQRFRLATDGGQSYLFALAHAAPVGADELCSWHDNGRHVIVEYSGEPGLDSAVAHLVRPD